MQHLDIRLKKIYEHDLDLLILEEFISDKGFARLFLDKVNLTDDYAGAKLLHSYSDINGESDITIILQYPNEKVAILIEDKIDAQTMPEQSARYSIRGDEGITRGEYDRYFVFLAAPAEYLNEHKNDPNAAYEHKVAYEELDAYFKSQSDLRSAFKSSIIDFAISEKKEGYQVQEVKPVTEFWIKLRKYCEENYPSLYMMGTNAPKGGSAAWPEFRTSLGNSKVIYKSQKGYVDLEFPGYGEKVANLYAHLLGKLTDGMNVVKTGKSASVRLASTNWAISFMDEFDNYRSVIDDVLQAVAKLCQLADKINYYELYQ